MLLDMTLFELRAIADPMSYCVAPLLFGGSDEVFTIRNILATLREAFALALDGVTDSPCL
ncbi:MAG: hypothetical protein OSB69_03500 [Alphaproteobacteria bacterium]|nr:hypothetical protein [Alphaproteobacteria bacterium]